MKPPNAQPGAAGRRVSVAAFGKTRGWEDFYDGPCDQSPMIRRAANELLHGAVRDFIQENEGRRMLVPDHPVGEGEWHFLWQQGGETLLGVMWPSQDERGRTQYPMIIGVDIEDADPGWLERTVLPLVKKATAVIREVKTQAEVIASLNRLRLGLSELLSRQEIDAAETAGEWEPGAVLRDIRFHRRGRLREQGVEYEPLAAETVALRLACPPGSCLSGWLAYLRGRVDGRIPLLAMAVDGKAYCDVFFGKPGSGHIEFLQKPLLEEPPAKDVTTFLPDMELQHRLNEVLAAVSQHWKEEPKTPVFKSAPKVQRLSAPVAPGPARHRRPPNYLLAAAGMAALMATAVLLFFLFHHTSAPGNPQEIHNASPPPVAVLSDDALKLRWYGYVNDFDHWLWFLVDTNGVQKAQSVAFSTWLAQVKATHENLELDPLAILGTSDPYNRKAPSLSTLRGRLGQFDEACEVRDEARAYLSTGLAADVGQETEALGRANLTGLAGELTAEIGEAGGKLTACVLASTNPPAAAPVPMPVSEGVNTLGQLEQTVSDLTNSLAAWASLRATLTTVDTNQLPVIIEQAANGLKSATNATTVLDSLNQLNLRMRAVSDWLDVNLTNLDRDRLQAALATSNLKTLDDWTNLAAGYLRIPQAEDPRPDLLNKEQADGLADLVHDIAGVQGQNSAPLVGKWTNLTAEINGLNAMAGIQTNLAAIDARTEKLQSEYSEMSETINQAWSDLFDLEKLILRERAWSSGNPDLDALWQQSLDRVNAYARAGGRKPSTAELFSWHTKCDQLRMAITEFYALKTGLVLPPSPIERTGDSAVAALLRKDFLTDLLELAVDPLTWTNRTSARDLVESGKAAELAAKLGTWWQACEVSEAAVELIDSRHEIPTNSAELLASAEVFVNDTNYLRQTVLLPEIIRTRQLTGECLLHDMTVSEIGGGEADERLPKLLLAAARIDATESVKSWSQVGALAGALKAADPGSQAPDWKSWLQRQWRQARSGGETFDLARAIATTLTGQGLELGDLPSDLAFNFELGNIVIKSSQPASHDSGEVLPLVEAALATGAQFPEDGKTGDDRALLQQIKGVLTGGLLGGTAFTELGPATAGARITTNSSGELVMSFGGTEYSFVLFEPADAQPFFLGTTELSAGQLAGLSQVPGLRTAIINKALVGQVTAFVNSGVSDQLSAILKDQTRRAKLFAHPAFDLFTQIPVVDANGNFSQLTPNTRFAGPVDLSGTSISVAAYPANFISPAWASSIAEGMGCRLPTTAEWKLVEAIFPRNNNPNPDNQNSPAIYARLAASIGADEATVRNLYLFETNLPVGDVIPGNSGGPGFALVLPGRSEAHAASATHRWQGDIAELLRAGDAYYVAGGSLASPPAAPFAPVMVTGTNANRGYADVGLRLALDWKGRRPRELAAELAGKLKPVNPP